MKVSRYLHTIRYLKPIQIRYQFWYLIRSKIRFLKGSSKDNCKDVKSNLLKFSVWIDKSISLSNQQFTFLNISHKFINDKTDWDFNEYGKLWTYNLNYMDYLLQADMSKEKGIELIELFIEQLNSNSTGNEPYPISLRAINWIKFLSKHRVQKQSIDSSLFLQYQILSNSLEYHLLGNHLLENAFSLLFGAFYFNNNKFYSKTKQILNEELNEQILNDGGHFELSPMYHQIILDRLLDAISLLQNNKHFNDQDQLLELFIEKASKMLTWLKNMTFQNGDIPHFNDSTSDIAATTTQVFEFAKHLNLLVRRSNSEGGNPQPATRNPQLSTSGYRKFKGTNYECIVDIGPIGPNYIPGHGHADMLSFVLYVSNKPLIVDTGISTYEKNEQRQFERSTLSHNTVVVDRKNQSDVWGGFRVGKRAKINILKDEPSIIEAEHNGYKPIIHNRTFSFEDNLIEINDVLSSSKKSNRAIFHFHPDRKIKLIENKVIIDDRHTIEFKNITKVYLESYNYPLGYNKYHKSIKCVVNFQTALESQILINAN